MIITSTDNRGQTHVEKNIKSFIITEDSGVPLVIVKESVLRNMNNYQIMTPGEPEFDNLVRHLGYKVEVSQT